MLSELLVMAASSNTGYFDMQEIFSTTLLMSAVEMLPTRRRRETRNREAAMSSLDSVVVVQLLRLW